MSEFPSDWHRDQYISDLERELEGAKIRGEEDYAKNVRDELARVKGATKQKTAAKRPRASAKKETR